MTTPDERTRAILHTRDLLEALLDAEAQPDVPDEVREEARRLLRHYPDAMVLRLVNLALPQHFASPTATPQ